MVIHSNLCGFTLIKIRIKDMAKLDAILWTGFNLKEVVEFTGKSPKFNEWFKTWDEYEKYVEDHNSIFKLFSPTGFSVDVYPNTWIVRLPDGFHCPVNNPWLK